MEGALRRSLGSQAQHTHSLEDHTWSIQQSTTTNTKQIHNIHQQNSNYTHTHCELFHQTIHKHCQARNTLIADVISNSDHITLNTNTPTRVPNTTLQQTSSPDITTGSWKKRARRDPCKTTRPIHLVKLFTDSSNTANL